MVRQKHIRKNTPQITIQQAHDLTNKQRPRQAFRVLFETISTTRKFQFDQHCENAMKLYIDIGVSLQTSCEEGFRKYQLLTQHNHAQSLENMIKYFIESVTNIGNKEMEIIQIDSKQQYESKILKYEWESFKSILKIIRNNHKLNGMYQNIVVKCIQFCKTLNRPTEFIDLCYLIRNRYNYIRNNQRYDNCVKINTISIINSIFETRLNILQCSLDMKLYNQSFKIIKDIQEHIFNYTYKLNKNISSYLCSLFYDKLSVIYWLSNKYFMHSFVLFQSYLQLKQYVNTKLKKQPETQSKLKNKLYELLQQSLLSLLIIMEYKNEKICVFGQKEKLQVPSKDNLLNIIIKEINTLIKEENGNVLCNIKELYNLIMNDINPMVFTQLVNGIIHKLETENNININFYKKKVYEMNIIVLIKSLGNMYKSMTWNRFRELTFSKDIISDIELEYIIICNVNNGIINCNISHSDGLIMFGNDKCDNNIFKVFMDLSSACNNININENKKYNNMREDVFNEIRKNIPMDYQLIQKKLECNKWNNVPINNEIKEDVNMEEINEREEIQMIEEMKSEHKINEEKKQREIISEREVQMHWREVIQNQNNSINKPQLEKKKKNKSKLERIEYKIKEINGRIQFEMKKKRDKNIKYIEKLIELLKKLKDKRQLELMKLDKIKFDYFCRGKRKYLQRRILKGMNNRNGSNENERKQIFKQERKEHKENYFEQIDIRDRLRDIRGKYLDIFEQIVIKHKGGKYDEFTGI